MVVREDMQLEREPLAVTASLNSESGRFGIANRKRMEEKKDFMPSPCDGIAKGYVR